MKTAIYVQENIYILVLLNYYFYIKIEDILFLYIDIYMCFNHAITHKSIHTYVFLLFPSFHLLCIREAKRWRFRQTNPSL